MSFKYIQFCKDEYAEVYYYEGKDFMEIIKGKILFNYCNVQIYYFNSSNMDTTSNILLEERPWHFDLIFQSEIKSDILYICKNYMSDGKTSSELNAYNVEDLLNENKKDKTPLFSFIISKSENVYGYCEYDNKYLLLDTFRKGIYIFDMDTKTKVAVCDVQSIHDKPGWNSFYIDYQKYCGKMHKLEDGQIIRIYPLLTSIDIRECISKEKDFCYLEPRVIFIGNYIVELCENSIIFTYQICN